MRIKRTHRIPAFQILLSLFILLGGSSLTAQAPQVKASMDSTQLWIGDQTVLRFEILQSKDKKVLQPLFSDTIVGNLEIVQQATQDTQFVADDKMRVEVNYVVTSFEDSLLYVPPMPFVQDGDTVWSNSMSLRVIQPFEIDTTSNSLADIKAVYKPKFNWKSLIQRVSLLLLVIILAVVLFLLVRKYSGKKPIIIKEKPVIIIPAHIEALEQLDALKEKKLWQQGREKEYHTELTDILRSYIDKMFNISSMEMTSDEILQHTQFLQVDKPAAHNFLRQILTLADLVKFAKWNPAPNDNEMSLNNAYLFINQTKIEEVKSLEELSKELKNKN